MIKFFRDSLAGIAFLLASSTTAALAHVGDHSHHSLRDLMDHLLEWDHLAMIAGAAVLAMVVFRKFRNRNRTKGMN